jgi:hypothetical protein
MEIDKEDLKLGVELEFGCSDNYEDYCSDLPYWEATEDGSIHSREFNQEVELVSEILNINEIPEAFNFLRREDKDNFRDYLEFNRTCGIHVHLSHKYFKELFHIWNRKDINRFTNLLYKEVNTKYPSVARNFKREYTSYPLRNSKDLVFNRYYTVNVSNANGHNTVEVRALNGCGLSKWSEIEDLINITIDVFIKFTNEQIKRKSKGFCLRVDENLLKDEKIEEIQEKHSELIECLTGG